MIDFKVVEQNIINDVGPSIMERYLLIRNVEGLNYDICYCILEKMFCLVDKLIMLDNDKRKCTLAELYIVKMFNKINNNEQDIGLPEEDIINEYVDYLMGNILTHTNHTNNFDEKINKLLKIYNDDPIIKNLIGNKYKMLLLEHQNREMMESIKKFTAKNLTQFDTNQKYFDSALL